MNNNKIMDGGPAFPCLEAKNAPNEGISLLGYFASQCDASLYDPLATLEKLQDKPPTTDELAEFIAFIKFSEAREMVNKYLKLNNKTL
jgi:hypothetical protein